MVQPVADTIMRNGNEIQRQRAEHDGYEFKIGKQHNMAKDLSGFPKSRIFSFKTGSEILTVLGKGSRK